VGDNTRRAVAHFSNIAILTLTINKLSLVSDDGDRVNEPSSLILNISIIDAIQRGSVNNLTLPATVISGHTSMQFN